VKLVGKIKVFAETSVKKSTLSAINPKWIDLGLNVDFRYEVPMINSLGQCTAHDFSKYFALKFVSFMKFLMHSRYIRM